MVMAKAPHTHIAISALQTDKNASPEFSSPRRATLLRGMAMHSRGHLPRAICSIENGRIVLGPYHPDHRQTRSGTTPSGV